MTITQLVADIKTLSYIVEGNIDRCSGELKAEIATWVGGMALIQMALFAVLILVTDF